ncbi:MAG: hypothetical protein KBT35_01260 [Firmicutes bacterium]|nr:hypothetical protein [Candidatus Colivicinus equi]
MTLEELYKKTKAWMFEKPSSTYYNDYILPICNKILAETYEENNMCRMFYGKLPFVDGVEKHQIPKDADMTKYELDYEDEYLLDVIPKGIDANFLMYDDVSKMDIYRVEYNNARVLHQKVVSKEKVDSLTAKAKEAWYAA